jgi:hypothetical protein
MRHLLRTAPRRPSLPVLSCVKIAPVQGAILLTSTDLNTETTISVPSPRPIGLAAKLVAKRANGIGQLVRQSCGAQSKPRASDA